LKVFICVLSVTGYCLFSCVNPCSLFLPCFFLRGSPGGHSTRGSGSVRGTRGLTYFLWFSSAVKFLLPFPVLPLFALSFEVSGFLFSSASRFTEQVTPSWPYILEDRWTFFLFSRLRAFSAIFPAAFNYSDRALPFLTASYSCNMPFSGLDFCN